MPQEENRVTEVYAQVPRNSWEALKYAREIGFPVEVCASFVPGGWQKTANTPEMLEQLFNQGRRVSPNREVILFWK